MTHGAMLKKITEAMKDLVTEANFDCSTTGVSVQAMVRAPPRHLCAALASAPLPLGCSDTTAPLPAPAPQDSSHVSLVALLLRADGFDHFRCDRNVSLGINLGSMGKVRSPHYLQRRAAVPSRGSALGPGLTPPTYCRAPRGSAARRSNTLSFPAYRWSNTLSFPAYGRC